MLCHRENRIEVAALIGLGILLALGAAALPWWHVTNTAEPGYVVLCRALLIGLASIALFALARPGYRGMLVWLGIGAIVLPCLVALILSTIDGCSLYEAVHEVKQSHRLMDFLESEDVNLGLAWTEESHVLSADILRNDLTLVDALETALFFTKGGWYLSILSGIILLLGAWTGGGVHARQSLVRCGPALSAVTVLLLCVDFGRLGLSYCYWNRARAAYSRADYASALDDYRTAVWWDNRLDYDTMYHFELGRVYGCLGMTQEPDYWAMIGDTYLTGQDPARAYRVYTRNIRDPFALAPLRMRYANALLRMGAAEFVAGRYGASLEYWQRAIDVDPNNKEIMYALGVGYTKLRAFPQAIVFWQKLIQANDEVGLFGIKYVSSYTYTQPLSARAWKHLGWCYYEEKDYEAAMRCDFYSTQLGAQVNWR